MDPCLTLPLNPMNRPPYLQVSLVLWLAIQCCGTQRASEQLPAWRYEMINAHDAESPTSATFRQTTPTHGMQADEILSTWRRFEGDSWRCGEPISTRLLRILGTRCTGLASNEIDGHMSIIVDVGCAHNLDSEFPMLPACGADADDWLCDTEKRAAISRAALYAAATYGCQLSLEERARAVEWAAAAVPSQTELHRSMFVSEDQRNVNPFVARRFELVTP